MPDANQTPLAHGLRWVLSYTVLHCGALGNGTWDAVAHHSSLMLRVLPPQRAAETILAIRDIPLTLGSGANLRLFLSRLDELDAFLARVRA